MSNKSRATVLSQKGSIGIQERRSSSDVDDGEAHSVIDMVMNEKRDILQKETNSQTTSMGDRLQPGRLSSSGRRIQSIPSKPSMVPEESDAHAIIDMVMNEKREALNKEQLGTSTERDSGPLPLPSTVQTDSECPPVTSNNSQQTQASIPGAYRVTGTSSGDDASVASTSDQSSVIVIPRAALVKEKAKDKEQPSNAALAPISELPIAYAHHERGTVLMKKKYLCGAAIVICLLLSALITGLLVAMLNRNKRSQTKSSSELRQQPTNPEISHSSPPFQTSGNNTNHFGGGGGGTYGGGTNGGGTNGGGTNRTNGGGTYGGGAYAGGANGTTNRTNGGGTYGGGTNGGGTNRTSGGGTYAGGANGTNGGGSNAGGANRTNGGGTNAGGTNGGSYGGSESSGGNGNYGGSGRYEGGGSAYHSGN